MPARADYGTTPTRFNPCRNSEIARPAVSRVGTRDRYGVRVGVERDRLAEWRINGLRLAHEPLRSRLAIERPIVNLFGLGAYRLFDVGGLIGTIGMLSVFVISAVRNTRALYLAEPLGGRQ